MSDNSHWKDYFDALMQHEDGKPKYFNQLVLLVVCCYSIYAFATEQKWMIETVNVLVPLIGTLVLVVVFFCMLLTPFAIFSKWKEDIRERLNKWKLCLLHIPF